MTITLFLLLCKSKRESPETFPLPSANAHTDTAKCNNSAQRIEPSRVFSEEEEEEEKTEESKLKDTIQKRQT